MALKTDVKSGGVYAVIQEKIPPLLTNIYPGNDATYYQDDFRKIEFKVDDIDSGINDENNIIVQIDDEKPFIFEYNIYRKQVSYSLDKKLLPGEHILKISVWF